MADKGIIFSAPMVRALLDGRKSQTRRLLNPQPVEHEGMNCRRLAFFDKQGRQRGDASPDGAGAAFIFTPYAPGDRLYVRESCYLPPKHISDRDMREGADTWPKVIFAEDDRDGGRDMMERCHWRSTPSIHMPRWASRLWLAVSEVRVQRLQEIGEADTQAEGAEYGYGEGASISQRRMFNLLWDSLHTDPGTRWADNPWIVAVSFDVNRGNIDA